ncbi:MAG: hypothetical protein ASARMPREDX12_002887 [Alectoria sarmentosa]|nr:MAG: hypothetical protein ASARMPRED_004419 [Alectoria sarmentosa]CAD6569702.1 MAG: hypothetical protein ASARMPREDX12_002887 [Alectoria sarmentosa]
MYRFLISHVKKNQKMSKPSETQNRWFSLPREIRDEIYREVLCKRYLIHWPARWKRGKAMGNEDRPLLWSRGQVVLVWTGLFWSGHVWMKKRPLFWADIALLLTSKAISQEAIDIMYKGSLFCVYVGQRPCYRNRMTPLPSQSLLDRMQNIEMGTCVCDTLDYTASETWFKHFNGGHTKRNTCRISFPCYYCLCWCSDHAPFFRACQSLVGFKTVTVTLELLCADAGEEEEVLSEVYNSMREDFKAALEPHLGPSRSYDVENVFCLEFHPRKHLEDVQATLPKSGGQALVLEADTEFGATT